MSKDEKSQAELEIEALADVFGIATTGFEEYYKSCKEKTMPIRLTPTPTSASITGESEVL